MLWSLRRPGLFLLVGEKSRRVGRGNASRDLCEVVRSGVMVGVSNLVLQRVAGEE